MVEQDEYIMNRKVAHSLIHIWIIESKILNTQPYHLIINYLLDLD